MKIITILVLWAVPALAAHAMDVTFTDVSAAAGVDRETESYGASVADVNGDGYPEIWVSNHRTRPSLYINQRNGTFRNAANDVVVWRDEPGRDTHGGSFADIDNDGDLDLLVTMGRNNDQQLLVNEDGLLVNQPRQWGIATAWIGGRLPLWYDYNGDRLIDVSVMQYAGVGRMYTNRIDHFTDDTSALDSVCVRNHYGHLIDITGDGVLDFMCSDESVFPQAVFDMTTTPWQRITWRFPLEADNVADSVVGDFDNDQRMDLFLLSGVQSRPSGATQHGDHAVEFRTQGGEKAISFVSDGPVTLDLDWNIFKRDDALTRIFVSGNGWHPSRMPVTLWPGGSAGFPARAPADETPAILIGYDDASSRWTFLTQTDNKWSDAYFQLSARAPVSGLDITGLWSTDHPARPTLWTADDGGWADTTAAAGLADPVLCASVTTGDFNNDMYLDLYLACRDGASNLPNVLYFGGPGGTFRRAADAAGAEGPTGAAIASGAGTADSVVSADFDLDGFLDLFVTNGFNMRPKFTGGPGRLFRNNANANNWVMLDLVGTASSTDAVGARVTATAAGITQLRVKNGGYHRWTQEHSRIHFGMADAQRVDIAIEWPSGVYDLHADVPVNRLYRAVEGGALEAFDPGQAAPACGAPSYDPAVAAAIYVWQNCDSDTWGLRATAGGGGVTYSGALHSDVPYDSVVPFSVESTDRLDTGDPTVIDFTMNVYGQWEDGVDFQVAPSSGKCFQLASDGEVTVLYGPERTPVSASFNPQTLQPCG